MLCVFSLYLYGTGSGWFVFLGWVIKFCMSLQAIHVRMHSTLKVLSWVLRIVTARWRVCLFGYEVLGFWWLLGKGGVSYARGNGILRTCCFLIFMRLV